MESIGVYCAHTAAKPWDTDSEFSKMSNQQLYFDSNSSLWVYDGTAPTWDNSTVTDKYTFFAYSPYVDEQDDEYIIPSIIDGELAVKYNVSEECALQKDLMLSIPRKDIYPQVGGTVHLEFKHTLSAIAFCVKGKSTEVITDIAIQGVVSSGQVTISDSGEVVWSYSGDVSSLKYSAGIDTEAIISVDTPTELTLENGYLMMIPQELDQFEIVLSVYSGESKSSSEHTFNLSEFEEWQAGEIYTYTINIGSYDYTIEGTSNCYILHPDDSEEQVFYIPVEGRINTFWRDYAGDEAVEGMLSSSDEWSADILWHDIEGGISGFNAERVTSGFSPSESVSAFSSPDFTTLECRSALKITLPATLSEGNILVAVKLNGQILWSWHLWITSYDPDSIAERCRGRINSGLYVYSIRSLEGEVHRLDNLNLWSGLYGEKFMMDRNLGARNCDFAEDQVGILHYQYARKDPFPYTMEPDTYGNRVSFAQAVQNPTTFYTQSDSPYSWSDEGLINTNQYLWGDVKVANDPLATGKSIFDPSPLGWKVPRNTTFDVLDNTNCKYSDSDKILYYNNEIKFPLTGFRSNQSGSSSSYTSQGNLRSSTAIDNSTAYNLVYNPTIDKSKNNTRADGFCIRCVEE